MIRTHPDDRSRARRPALAALAALAVLLLAGGACAAPGEIQTAARLQQEALAEARQGVAAYSELTDEVLERAVETRRTSREYQVVLEVVDEMLAGEMVEDPLAASEELLGEIRSRQRKISSPDLERLRRDHARNLEDLQTLLLLLERGQALITEYLLTDLGPAPEQVRSLGEELRVLEDRLAGEGP